MSLNVRSRRPGGRHVDLQPQSLCRQSCYVYVERRTRCQRKPEVNVGGLRRQMNVIGQVNAEEGVINILFCESGRISK